ncbi:MAG: hypothetical protein R2729_01095 [Bryobacteraceae bacterium]
MRTPLWLAVLLSVPASAGLLTVTSYDMPNGGFGSPFQANCYFDDAYGGSSTLCPDGGMAPITNAIAAHAYEPLAGSTGELTDGVTTTQHWHENNQPWVGWLDSNQTDPAYCLGVGPDAIDLCPGINGTTPGSGPVEIVFHFGGPKTFLAFRYHGSFNDTTGCAACLQGSVWTPLSVEISDGVTTQTLTNFPSNTVAWTDWLDLAGMTGEMLVMRLHFLSEVNPDAPNHWVFADEVQFSDIPEPRSFALLGAGLLALSVCRIRRL